MSFKLYFLKIQVLNLKNKKINNEKKSLKSKKQRPRSIGVLELPVKTIAQTESEDPDPDRF